MFMIPLWARCGLDGCRALMLQFGAAGRVLQAMISDRADRLKPQCVGDARWKMETERRLGDSVAHVA